MTAHTYTVKALESYRYDKEECIEALSYALSLNENNVVALCLMGRIQMEMFEDHSLATEYFENALVADPTYSSTYKHYFDLFISVGNIQRAKSFLNYATKNIPHRKADLLMFEAKILEVDLKFGKALKMLKKAEKYAFDEGTLFEIDEHVSRIERKRKKSFE